MVMDTGEKIEIWRTKTSDNDIGKLINFHKNEVTGKNEYLCWDKFDKKKNST